MANVHVHLHVTDLQSSTAFYERLLGTSPVKTKPNYVKFLPELAPLNLALSAGDSGANAAVSHLGFEVESKDAVQLLLQRTKIAGLEVREEMSADCCYSNQDKFWVVDPDGVEWEIYHVNHDVEADAQAPAANTCCAPTKPIALGKRPLG